MKTLRLQTSEDAVSEFGEKNNKKQKQPKYPGNYKTRRKQNGVFTGLFYFSQ